MSPKNDFENEQLSSGDQRSVEPSDAESAAPQPLRLIAEDGTRPFDFRDLKDALPLTSMVVRLGTAEMTPAQYARRTGVLILDQDMRDEVEVVVDGAVVGYGELVSVDGTVGVRLTRLVTHCRPDRMTA